MDAPYRTAMARLVTVVQELSLARDLSTVMTIVRRAARALTGADGACFILREGDRCYYADEDAIGPLWKGQRFPMSACISGWAMQHRAQAVIEDIYTDPRIPVEAYAPTFVKSLVMVPIRTVAPIGAIGTYWAQRHRATPDEVEVLQALADSTSVALENVHLYADLEQRVRDRTAQLEAALQELDAFAYSVSHDLRAPLRHIEGFSQILLEHAASTLDAQGQQCLEHIRAATQRMGRLIEDLLALSRAGRAPLRRQEVDLTAMAQEITATLRAQEPDRQVEVLVANGMTALADPGLARVVLENLLANAWKFTSTRLQARIECGWIPAATGTPVYFIRDNGVGFDPRYADRLFGAFQRLHAEADFPGTGIGLATVQRIVHRHGGRIWAAAAVDAGAIFAFTLHAGREHTLAS